MEDQKTQWVEVDEQGRLVLPAELARSFGLQPGARARLDKEGNSLRLHRPANHLAKVYLEPTNRCNLVCRTCIRNNWDVELGEMSSRTFERILQGLGEIDPPPTVLFGGLGEPLRHPEIVEMVAAVKALGCRAELITNGTLLKRPMARSLIAAGLDLLWVSLDGATPESYADVRLGAALPEVIENVTGFRRSRPPAHRPKPEIGVVFVAMRRNIADLPQMLRLSRRLGAVRVYVTNLLPYTQEMRGETLFRGTLNDITYLPSPWLPQLNLPKIEFNPVTQGAYLAALQSGFNVTLAGNNLGSANDVCTFIESGALSIDWQGNLCPCPPLMHDHTSYLNGRARLSQRHVVGNVNERSLLELWEEPDYVAYRERVQSFAFAPCTTCGGCEMAEGNQDDCLGNVFPACGGCLWTQGVIGCP